MQMMIDGVQVVLSTIYCSMRDIFVTTYLATDLGIQTATANLSRASEAIGGWIGAEVRTTECAA